ncbi:MAG: thiolase domain-containing protein [Candidatus Thorarchaeota archaeon]
MINVSIVGAGQTKFGRHDEYGLRELFAIAAHRAIEDAGISPKDVEAAFIGNLSADQFNRQSHIAPMMVDAAGMKGIPATKCEAACASSATALRAAILAIESGHHEVVMAAGVEKMTDLATPGVIETLAMAADQPFEAEPGITFPGIFALFATAHMAKYGTTKEQLAAVAVKNHANAVHNPFAQYQKEINLGQVLSARMVAWPLGLFDCSPITDGAAAVILTTKKKARKFTDTPVKIIASEQASDTMDMCDRTDLTSLYAAKTAADRAYKQARIFPLDVDFAEVHDCFTIAEIIATEDLGFFKPGEGGKAVAEGLTKIDGHIAINTSGGLKAKGHPVGATGVAQIIELFHQLRNEAGKRQIDSPNYGLAHNVGGSGATALVHICERW